MTAEPTEENEAAEWLAQILEAEADVIEVSDAWDAIANRLVDSEWTIAPLGPISVTRRRRPALGSWRPAHRCCGRHRVGRGRGLGAGRLCRLRRPSRQRWRPCPATTRRSGRWSCTARPPASTTWSNPIHQGHRRSPSPRSARGQLRAMSGAPLGRS